MLDTETQGLSFFGGSRLVAMRKSERRADATPTPQFGRTRFASTSPPQISDGYDQLPTSTVPTTNQLPQQRPRASPKCRKLSSNSSPTSTGAGRLNALASHKSQTRTPH